MFIRRPRFIEATWEDIPDARWIPPISRTDAAFDSNEFTCMRQTARVEGAEGWQRASTDKLWLYHLHYFDVLAAPGADRQRESLRELIARWIAENPAGKGVGWEPYPISRRIVNWCKWRLAGGEFPADAQRSLATQADFLSRTLEYDVLGNHLIANAKALTFAGALLRSRDSESWRAKGLDILRSQVREQLLPDGGHYERSPMYHAAVLEDLLDIENLGSAFGWRLPEPLIERPGPMLSWLQAMTHPDGHIALFNDAVLDGAPTAAQLRGYAVRLGRKIDAPTSSPLRHLASSGYASVSLGDLAAMLDVAPLGPDFQPGHGHADTLSFELSLGRHRLIVDTGTSTYTNGAERCRQRGTAAHNTIDIDETDSSEVWGAFRVGRRARVVDVHARDEGKVVTVSAAHDGYRAICAGGLHRRTWRIENSLVRIEDELTGGGSHRLRWSLHFAPDVKIESAGDASFGITAKWLKTPALFRGDPAWRWSLEPSSYHPSFGVSVANTRIVGRIETRLPTRIEAALSW